MSTWCLTARQKSDSHENLLGRNLTDGDDALEKISGSIVAVKKLHIKTRAFNCSQRYFIFLFRVFVLGCVIFCGFAAIQFFHKDYVLGIFNTLVMTQGAFLYPFCYDKGFSIPRSTARLQSLLVLRLKQSQVITEMQKSHKLRQLRSLPKMAVRVGNFHQLQRVSTPTFLDFSIKNLVRVVMFYRKYALSPRFRGKVMCRM